MGIKEKCLCRICVRKLVASLYWDLKRDFEQIEEKELFYDVGMMVGLCRGMNRATLANKLYTKFMPD